jgi:hypothetical protein
VVFPNIFKLFPRGHLATWNAGHCYGCARDKKVDDIAFVSKLSVVNSPPRSEACQHVDLALFKQYVP